MKSTTNAQPLAWRFFARLTMVWAGVFGLALAMLLLLQGSSPASLDMIGGPVMAVALMAAGMIAAAASGRLSIGFILAVLNGVGLILLALALGLSSKLNLISAGIALLVASISFAARGTLFARSSPDKGWWIALFVVAGEAAILATAAAQPDALPAWLLVLLPAQWTNIAIQNALFGADTLAASSALIALAGTAAATLVVVGLWPRRWPYLLMFTAWLGLSALVYYRPSPPLPSVDTGEVAGGDYSAQTLVAASFIARRMLM